MQPCCEEVKGPAKQLPGNDTVVEPGSESFDIIDEAIDFFRANILFKTFELQNPADKVASSHCKASPEVYLASEILLFAFQTSAVEVMDVETTKRQNCCGRFWCT